MRILVLGGEGMLGHKMFQVLRGHFAEEEVICTIRGSLSDPAYAAIELFHDAPVIEQFDALRFEYVAALLRELKPEVVTNCIGIVTQANEAGDELLNIGLNAYLPHLVAHVLQEWGGRLIHYSTDCVFTGKRGQYQEEDEPDATDLYGRTKTLGEVTRAENALTLRTSIIGRELFRFRSLLEWFLSQEGKKVQGYTGAIYSGVTTNYLAELTAKLIRAHPHLHGLYQVASEPISKYNLLVLIREAFRLNIEIEPVVGKAADKSLRSDRFVAATGYVCPPWPQLVAELAQDPTPYARWRAGQNLRSGEHNDSPVGGKTTPSAF